MQYAWSSELETGYRSIDEQHKQLVLSLNELLAACQHGKHRYELDKTLDFLLVYTTTHFADEEEFQLKHKYPEYERHKRLHDDFKVVASELVQRLMREGATISLIAEVHSTIGDWLVNHIKGEDLKIARHARGEQI
jgi:hemerythrin